MNVVRINKANGVFVNGSFLGFMEGNRTKLGMHNIRNTDRAIEIFMPYNGCGVDNLACRFYTRFVSGDMYRDRGDYSVTYS